MKKNSTKYNLIGKRFGKLLVIEHLGTKNQHTYWRCVCDCGKETNTRNQNLLSGKSKSCGCGDIQRKRDLANRLKESNKKDPKTVAQRQVFLYYKKGAISRNLEWSLSEDTVIELINSRCYYCNSIPNNVVKVYRSDGNIEIKLGGIDRVDNSKGYTKENVVPCCKICNTAKMQMTLPEFKNWIKSIYERMKLL